jgi:hypothetical protein
MESDGIVADDRAADAEHEVLCAHHASEGDPR